MKKYAEGGKLPQDLVDEIARKKNEEDRELIAGPLRALKNKISEDLTGGAYVGSRLNMGKDRGSRLGRLSKEDAAMLKRQDDESGRNMMPKKMAKGGKVSSASKRGDGCAIKGKTKGRMV
jgi:hypothetical protein